ncbi:waterproof [Carabus blaptoides fortunei]
MSIKNVNIVFHMAATVNFIEKLRIATAINVRGTLESLLLAKEMLNLKTMIYVSTAYAHCIYSDIDEKFYDTPISSDELMQLTNILNDDQLDALLPHLLGKWPNTYVFTKAIAENLVKTVGKDLPIAIVRPSIKPIVGWINNYYGIVGVTLGSAIGLIHTLPCDPDVIVDLVPADYCVNMILAAAWDAGKRKKNPAGKSSVDPNDIISDDISIYNYVGSVQKPITYRKYMSDIKEVAMTMPSEHCISYFILLMCKNKYIYLLAVIFLHLLPAYIMTFFCWISGSKLRYVNKSFSIYTYNNIE